MPGRLLNHAPIELKKGQNSGEARVTLNDKKIGMLHGVTKPGAEFDVVIKDLRGNEQARHHFKAANERFGKRIDLELPDDMYVIVAEEVKGADKIDIFVE